MVEGGWYLKRFLTIVLSVFIIAAGFIVLRFGSALSQEGNPVPILVSISKLEFTNSNFEQFFESDKKLRFVSKNSGEFRYDVVKEFMKEKGWDYKDQMGSGLIFENDKQTIIVETRQFSRHYFLWDIPNHGVS
ncbi:hypothetical protein EDM59_05760 [Brevibacillus nitrificans]|uniref:Uncharacterized protein n=1 Tax=Brevibacillus nitrificans TaxID=651560 RepID=A0A3M8DLV8_9BACL|nr:hypothetical protein EDM59_05760 [Brevibacillus nitrificans]